MEGKTHRSFGVIVMGTALISAGVPPGLGSAVALAVSAFAAYGPDLDSEQSTISRTIPGGSMVGHVLRHRTVLHSILVSIVIWLLLNAVLVPWYVLAGIVLGWSSHWFIDLFNKEGVQLLWPLHLWIKVFPGDFGVSTGSDVELLIRKILMLIEVFMVWGYFSTLFLKHMTTVPFAEHIIRPVYHWLSLFHWSIFAPFLHTVLHMP